MREVRDFRGEFTASLEGMTVDELLDLRLQLEAESGQIRGQLEQAVADAKIHHVYADPDWFRRANAAVRFKGWCMQVVQIQTGRIKAAEKAERRLLSDEQDNWFLDAFRKEARRLLDYETYHSIVSAANLLLAGGPLGKDE